MINQAVERILPFLLPLLSGLAAGIMPLEGILPSPRWRAAGGILRGALGVLAGSLLSPAALAPPLGILAAVYGDRVRIRLWTQLCSRKGGDHLPLPNRPASRNPDPQDPGAPASSRPGLSPQEAVGNPDPRDPGVPAASRGSPLWVLAGALLAADPLLALSWLALSLVIGSLSSRPGMGPALAGFLLPLRFLDLAGLPGLGVGAALWIPLLAAALPLQSRSRD